MKASGEKGGMLQALRSSADAALKRLAPSPSRPEKAAQEAPPDRPVFADPTTTLFPSGEGADDEGGRRALPLSSLLEDSSRAMVRRAVDLRERSGKLATLISARRDAEVTLAAQVLRIAIGLMWFGVAVWLFYSILSARADGVGVIAGGVPIADAKILLRSFLLVAATGLGVGFGFAALVMLFGNTDNGRITREAEALGGEIAKASGEFDETLSMLRQSMDKRQRPADAVDEVSRAHLTALEAWAFFREVSFLTDGDQDKAQRMFNGFLSSRGYRRSSSFMDFLNGALFGALIVFMIAVPKPAPIEILEPITTLPYPWAVQLILLGGLIYALAGVLTSVFAEPLSEGAARRARADALIALRSGFSSHEALRKDDLIRRIEDTVDVFRARVGGTGAASTRPGSAITNHPNADFDGDGEIPEWRRRDSSAKFVETAFAGAPQQWRTDAYAKKFEGEKSGKTESKREPKTP